MSHIARPSVNAGAGASAIEFHYDTGNRFFELWLDPDMTYSGAAFEGPGDTLETAQRRKIDHHLREARLAPGGRLLEVGCGWGSTLSRALTTHGAGSAVGLTLSPSQAAYVDARHVQAGGLKALDVRVESWADHRPDAPYDAIISIGAFEHFARPELSREQKVASYRAFFERCRAWLRPGGYLSLQTIAWNRLQRADASAFIIAEIFPETDPPEPSELWDGLKSNFEVRQILADREGYAETLRHWYRNLRRQRRAAIEVAGEDTVKRFERYLSLCAVAFHTGNLTLLRLTLQRLDDATDPINSEEGAR